MPARAQSLNTCLVRIFYKIISRFEKVGFELDSSSIQLPMDPANERWGQMT